jgi:nucleotide-binding universal stress UspA family protein
MFNKILVAIDNSRSADQVFAVALALAKQRGGKLLLMHVITAGEEGTPEMPLLVDYGYSSALLQQVWQSYQADCDRFAKQQHDRLSALVREAAAAGVEADYSLASDGPGRSICREASTCGADLIVMGRHGHSVLGEMVLGSTSSYVLHHAPCSVLTVQDLQGAEAIPPPPELAQVR